MKSFILATVMALGFTSVAAAGPIEDCSKVSNLITVLAENRDLGMGPEEAYFILVNNGLSEELAVTLLETVYLQGSQTAPDQLGAKFFMFCVQDAA